MNSPGSHSQTEKKKSSSHRSILLSFDSRLYSAEVAAIGCPRWPRTLRITWRRGGDLMAGIWSMIGWETRERGEWRLPMCGTNSRWINWKWMFSKFWVSWCFMFVLILSRSRFQCGVLTSFCVLHYKSGRKVREKESKREKETRKERYHIDGKSKSTLFWERISHPQ